jgi:hypothetical protein
MGFLCFSYCFMIPSCDDDGGGGDGDDGHQDFSLYDVTVLRLHF